MTSTVVDFSPLANVLIQILAVIIGAIAVPGALYLVNWLRSKLHLSQIQVDAGLQAKIDAEAQKAIGGAFTRLQVTPGSLSVDVKNAVVAEAAGTLVGNATAALKAKGVTDVGTKAAEIIENRLGLMAATAAGTPVPNPSQTPPAPAPAVGAPLVITPVPKP